MMKRNRFLPFLLFSLGAHLAALLLWRAERGGADAPLSSLTVFLPSVQAPASSPPPSSPSPASPSVETPRRASPIAAASAPEPPRVKLPNRRPADPPDVYASSPASPKEEASSDVLSVGTGAESPEKGSSGRGDGPSVAEVPSGGKGGGTGDLSSGPSSIPGDALPLTRAEADYARNPPPPYPRIARERGWEGTVRLQVRVSAAGEVAELKVESSSGHAVLDRAALEAVRGWRFRPARLGERPVEGVVLVPVAFTLRPS